MKIGQHPGCARRGGVCDCGDRACFLGTPDPFVPPIHTDGNGTPFVRRATVVPMESAEPQVAEPPRHIIVAVFQVHGESPMLSFEWKDNVTVTLGPQGDVDASWKVEEEAWQLFYRANDLEPGQVFCTSRVIDMPYRHVMKGSRPIAFPELSNLTIS